MKIIENESILQKTLTDKSLKEDLERYYIDEEKSMLKISKIYGCSSTTIGNKLVKYGIPIRPYGAFLVDDDGITLKSKYNRGEISSSEYSNKKVIKNGYKDYNEYERKRSYKKGKHLPMHENKECAKYLGVHICENKEFLSKIINIVEIMQCNNPGYDVVCSKDRKIDVKCSCSIDDKRWTFHINKNKIADYFLMISFDNRENLNIQHIWLVKGDTIIEKTTWNSKEFIVNEKDTISIGKGVTALKRWIKHEITDTYKLEEAQKLCNGFKNNNITND